MKVNWGILRLLLQPRRGKRSEYTPVLGKLPDATTHPASLSARVNKLCPRHLSPYYCVLYIIFSFGRNTLVVR